MDGHETYTSIDDLSPKLFPLDENPSRWYHPITRRRDIGETDSARNAPRRSKVDNINPTASFDVVFYMGSDQNSPTLRLSITIDHVGDVVEARGPRYQSRQFYTRKSLVDLIYSTAEEELRRRLRRKLRAQPRSRLSSLSDSSAKHLSDAVVPHLWFPQPEIEGNTLSDFTRSDATPTIMELVTRISAAGLPLAVRVDSLTFLGNSMSIIDSFMTLVGGGLNLAVILSALQLVDACSSSFQLFRLTRTDWDVFTDALITANAMKIRETLVANRRGCNRGDLLPHWARLEQATLIEVVPKRPAPSRFIAKDYF